MSDKPSGRELEAVAQALHARFPTTDPTHVRIGVSWDELSEASRRTYRGRAVGVIAARDAVRSSAPAPDSDQSLRHALELIASSKATNAQHAIDIAIAQAALEDAR